MKGEEKREEEKKKGRKEGERKKEEERERRGEEKWVGPKDSLDYTFGFRSEFLSYVDSGCVGFGIVGRKDETRVLFSLTYCPIPTASLFLL